MASLTSLIIVYTEPNYTLTLPNLMRINLQARNSWCSTKITNDDRSSFCSRYVIVVIPVRLLGFFLVVLRPVSHSPLENALFLLGTKTDLLLGQQHNCAATGSRDHKSFVALLCIRVGPYTYYVEVDSLGF